MIIDHRRQRHCCLTYLQHIYTFKIKITFTKTYIEFEIERSMICDRRTMTGATWANSSVGAL
jgi:hypothetical protein